MDFASYWQLSDLVTKGLFFILLILSLLSWVTGIMRVLQSRQLALSVADDLSQQIQDKRPELVNADAATRRLVTEQTLLKHIGRYRFASERGLPILGTTAAIAPFIGLFGTVWGIFHALHNIGTSGQAGLGQVAGPVGEALIMTGLGIAVAIPAVVFYNLAVRINRRVMYHANDRAHDLLAQSVESTTTQQAVEKNQPVLKSQASTKVAIVKETNIKETNIKETNVNKNPASQAATNQSAGNQNDGNQNDGYHNSATSRS